jgi:hypothetical protein
MNWQAFISPEEPATFPRSLLEHPMIGVEGCFTIVTCEQVRQLAAVRPRRTTGQVEGLMRPGDRGKEIVLPEATTVAELARLLDLTARQLITTAFQELGLLLTISEPLQFERSRALAAQFGFVARRGAPPPDS